MVLRPAPLALLVCVLCLVERAASQPLRPKVRIGYELTYTPEKLAMHRGYFEKFTGYDIEWVEITDTSKAISALENGDIDLCTANSLDIARAFTRKAAIRLIYISELMADSQALLVREGYPDRYEKPSRLAGKRVGAAWGSPEHYLTVRMIEELGLELMTDQRYQYVPNSTQCKAELQPCYFEPRPNAVEIPKLNSQQVEEAFVNGSVHAAFVGFPQMVRLLNMRQSRPGNNGRNKVYQMITAALLQKWNLLSFRGLLVRQSWAIQSPTSDMLPNVTHTAFLQKFVYEYAKSVYYYENNTKEFFMGHMAEAGVNYKLASVINGQWQMVHSHLAQFGYISQADQLTCKWLGCGGQSMLAWALRDQALFLETLKTSYAADDIQARDEHSYHTRQRSAESGLHRALDTSEEYAAFFDMTYMRNNIEFGYTGPYELQLDDVAVPLRLGYGDQYVDTA